jgi:modulator of FtsH protease
MMQQSSTTYESSRALTQNRVLRNTYLLLALSMVPTVIGALIGVQLKFAPLPGSPFISALLFLGIAIGFFYAIEKYKNSGIGVALLLGFTFFMGLMLSRLLQVALGFANGGTLIATAGAGTAGIFVTMATIATVSKRDFSKMGKFLFAGVIVLLLASLANIFFQIPALTLAISAAVVLVFSLYLLFDVSNIVQGGETNYVSATLAVYLDVYNIFSGLLQLVMAFGGDRD